ncbi:DUF3263 domain-containing protein [Gordonia malaquae]|uniref:DUF3263 domain-containing protein n=1 Tax=Gordonia malaquae TaxID=410332 RepID=UPI0030C79580
MTVHCWTSRPASGAALAPTPPQSGQRIGRLCDDPGALAYAPQTVNRLRQLRSRRTPRARG